jgi:hypothetical protein
MARMPSTLGERRIPNATRRVASYDPSAGISAMRRGSAAVGDGLDDLAKGLQSVEAALYEEQLRDEERAVKNLDVEWSKKRREILFGDGTPNKPGFFATAGEDTLNARPNVEKELNTARGQIMGKAKGARVRQAFDLASSASLQGELEQVDRYTIGQRREANIATSKASITEAKQQAATYFSDPTKWQAAVDRIATESASLGDIEGWSQETTNTFTQSQISEAASDRVKRALLTDAKGGETAYMEMRDMIDGDMRIEIEQDIKAAKKAEEVDKRLREAEARQARDDAERAAFDEWAPKVLLGGATAKDIALDPRLDGRSKFALANALEAKADKGPTTNWTTWNNAFSRIHLPDGHPDKITDWKELLPYQREMQFSDWEQLRQEALKQSTPEGSQEATLLKQTYDFADKTLTYRDPDLGISDPKGEELLQKATVEISKAWDKGIKDGISPAELADPESQHFVGKIVKQLQRPLAQIMQDRIDSLRSLNISPTGDAASAAPSGPGGRAMPVAPKVEQDVNGVYLPKTPAEKALLPKGARYKKPGSTEMQYIP